MTTPYSDLFTSFSGKIEDPIFIEMGAVAAEQDMIILLNSAIIRFDYPKVDIFNKDDVLMIFNETLSIHEIEILAYLMKLQWISRQVDSIYNIKHSISDKDFRRTSQANHLLALLHLEKRTKSDVSDLITTYSYKDTSNNRPDYSGLSGGE